MIARAVPSLVIAVLLAGGLACSKESPRSDQDESSSENAKKSADDEPAKKKRACTPGKQESCACLGGAQGVQICKADGSGLGKCACPEPEEATREPEPAKPQAMPTAPTAKPTPKAATCVGEEVPCPLADGRHGWCKSSKCVDMCGRGKTYVALDAACHVPCTKSCSNCQEGGCLD
jgi:hypothetical protein